MPRGRNLYLRQLIGTGTLELEVQWSSIALNQGGCIVRYPLYDIQVKTVITGEGPSRFAQIFHLDNEPAVAFADIS
jgi:hypothetical protein